MKLRTQGLSLKIPAQAVTTLVVAALAHFGVDLDAETSAALGVVFGFVAGYFAPAASVAVVPADGEAGYGIVELLIAAILLLVFIWLVFAIAH